MNKLGTNENIWDSGKTAPVHVALTCVVQMHDYICPAVHEKPWSAGSGAMIGELELKCTIFPAVKNPWLKEVFTATEIHKCEDVSVTEFLECWLQLLKYNDVFFWTTGNKK